MTFKKWSGEEFTMDKNANDIEMWREEYVRHIRSIGESLIKNASSIVGNEKYLSINSGIDIYMTVRYGETTEVHIGRTFIPEKLVEG